MFSAAKLRQTATAIASSYETSLLDLVAAELQGWQRIHAKLVSSIRDLILMGAAIVVEPPFLLLYDVQIADLQLERYRQNRMTEADGSYLPTT